MNENLTPQIVAALLQDGTVKMTGEEIAAAIADAIGALDKPYRFRGVATPGLAPGKILEQTLFVAVAVGTYGSFSNQSVDKGQIVFFTSDDGAVWSDVVAYCGGDGCPIPPGPEPPTPSAKPLTFTAQADGVVLSFHVPDFGGEEVPKTIEVSTDGGQTWTEKTASIEGTELATLDEGEEVQVRGNNDAYSLNFFHATGPMAASGNIMSLIDAENFVGKQLTPGVNDNAFAEIFSDDSGTLSNDWLTLAPELPATTLAPWCYSGMFANCTSLTKAPELPATILAEDCYSSMFLGCTSLTQAPELPATTLAEGCYANMFNGCTSLTQAPELPATTLAPYCYSSMFTSCTSLTEITCLAEDISSEDATNSWLEDVPDSGTFTKAAGVAWPSGTSGIPEGWTVVEA